MVARNTGPLSCQVTQVPEAYLYVGTEKKQLLEPTGAAKIYVLKVCVSNILHFSRKGAKHTFLGARKGPVFMFVSSLIMGEGCESGSCLVFEDVQRGRA